VDNVAVLPTKFAVANIFQVKDLIVAIVAQLDAFLFIAFIYNIDLDCILYH
jgi:hypothetical protein